ARACPNDANAPAADTRGSTIENRVRCSAVGVRGSCPRFAEAAGAKAWQNRCGALSVQESSQRLAIVVLCLLGHAGIRYPIEAVIRPRIHVKLDRHPGAAQSIRIDHVFFAEEIKTANRNVARRYTRHIRRSRSRRIRRDVGRTRLFAEQRTPAEIVVLLRPDELADVRMQVLAHRRAVVNHRIDQMLKGEFWSLQVAW